MIAQNKLNSNEIRITEPDFDRLNALVDSPRYRATHPSFLMLLKEELNRGNVVPGDEVGDGVVTMRSRVRVRDLSTEEPEIYELMYPDEADIREGRLSVLAPLGIALLGAKVGRIVTFDTPGGRRRIRVEKILYQPEAAGDLHL